jgi:hypothetical protein
MNIYEYMRLDFLFGILFVIRNTNNNLITLLANLIVFTFPSFLQILIYFRQ